jgi:hypothetical protein
MSLLPIKNLKDIHGYDEFIFGEQKILICIIGYAMQDAINYYDEKTLMLQMASNYRQRDQNAK